MPRGAQSHGFWRGHRSDGEEGRKAHDAAERRRTPWGPATSLVPCSAPNNPEDHRNRLGLETEDDLQ
jgi:hypothetical protein